MKLTKKLIPALGMLVLSACMLVTSTFAWFSMNTQVSATNMQVTAVTDQIFLQIVKGANNKTGFVNGTIQSVAEADANNKKYSAVNVYADDTGAAYAGGNTLTWLTATANDPAVSTKTSDFAEVEADTYTYKTQYTLRLDPTAGAVAGGKLMAEVAFAGTYTDAIAKAVAVLVVCEDDNLSMLFTQDSTGAFKKTAGDPALTADKFPASTLTEVKTKTVTIYVFFDGTNVNCTTNNATAAKNAPYAVNVTFNVNTTNV